MADSDHFRDNGYGFLVNGEDVPDDWGGDRKAGNASDDLDEMNK